MDHPVSVYLYYNIWFLILGFTQGFFVQIGECDLDCGRFGTCVFGDGLIAPKYCHCHAGHEGERCERTQLISLPPCASSPCKNGGACYPYLNDKFYGCNCPIGFSGHNCEATQSTTPGRPLVAATNPLALITTTLPAFIRTCSKFSAVYDVLEKIVQTNDMAWRCESGNHSSPEAFVLNNCGLDTPTKWKQGSNVLQYCGKIPIYTPIASFANGKYSSSEGLTGIFVGCVDNAHGFKIMIQRCDQTPTIEIFDQGETLSNAYPTHFYTIEL